MIKINLDINSLVSLYIFSEKNKPGYKFTRPIYVFREIFLESLPV